MGSFKQAFWAQIRASKGKNAQRLKVYLDISSAATTKNREVCVH